MNDEHYARVVKQVQRWGGDDDVAEEQLETVLQLVDRQQGIIDSLTAELAEKNSLLRDWRQLYADLKADVKEHLAKCSGRS